MAKHFLQQEYPAHTRPWPRPDDFVPQTPATIRIMDSDLSIVAEIEDYESLVWTRRWHRPGEFELHINRHKKYADELIRGRLIMVDGDPARCGIIRYREINLNKQGKLSEGWRIRGYSLASITEQRITVPPNLAYDVVDDAAETVMKTYIKHNITEPQNDPFDERRIDIVSVAVDAGRGPRTRWQTRYKNLTNELEGVSQYSGIGWDIRPDYINGKWEFDVFDGVDRSVSQSDRAPVIFGVDRETIEQLMFLDSDIDYKNLAYVCGQGEGADREVARVAGGVQEAVRIESTDDHWEAGTLDKVEAENDSLILETVIPAGTDISFTETLDADWENYALMDGLAAQDDNLISIREPVVAGDATFTTVGSNSWTVPDGVYQIYVLCVAGGGGGGNGIAWQSGGGGGAGEVYYKLINVTPGQSINYVIGGGGAAPAWNGTTGTDGGNSSFGSITCKGGGGGGSVTGYSWGSKPWWTATSWTNGRSGGSGGGGATGKSGGASTKTNEGGHFGNAGGSNGGGGGGAGGAGSSGQGGAVGAGIVVRGVTYGVGGRGGLLTSQAASGYGGGGGAGYRSNNEFVGYGKAGNPGIIKIWWDDQTGTGNRITKPINLSSIVTAKDSEIIINKEEPDGYDGEVKVYALVNSTSHSVPALDSVGWQEQTSGNALTVITPNEDYRGKFLWLKQVITIDVINDPTPYIEDYTVTIEDVGIRYYEGEGQRTSPPLALEGVVKAGSSAITWSSTEPAGTDLVIETAVNSDPEDEPVGSYEGATNGDAIPSILPGESMLGKYLWVRQQLAANVAEDATPYLHSLSVSVLGSDISNSLGECVFNPDDTITVDDIGDIVEDMEVMFQKDGADPAEIINSTWYYVINIVGDTFQVSETEGGAAVEFTGGAGYTGEAFEKVATLPTGLSRYEMFVDARDISEDEFLPARGKRKLAEHEQTKYLEAQVLTRSMYRYRQHYNLGDIVTVKNDDWGVTLDARITEAQEIWETSGYLVRLTFNNRVPDVLDRMKSIIREAEYEVRR
jgi:hypothetical protein